jgi:hypothetical protein
MRYRCLAPIVQFVNNESELIVLPLQMHVTDRTFRMLLLFIAFGVWCTSMRGTEYYGSGVQFDVLDNQQVAEYDVDYRFRAVASSSLSSFIWYDVYKKGGSTSLTCDGYGCGTGGSVDICIFDDNGRPNHLWTGKPLGCVTDSNLRSGDRIRTEIFPVPPRLTAGKLYHLHWHNTDPSPTKNFISVDDICVWHPTTPRQPTIPDIDLAVLLGTKELDGDTPFFQLSYADGTTQGQGYKESWNYSAESISGGAKVREKITVSGSNRTVTSVSVRVNRVSGGSPLIVTLADGSGAIIEQGKIPALRFPDGFALNQNVYGSKYVRPSWGTYLFASPHILTPGQSYQLILSSPSDTVYQGYGIQRASGYKFTNSTFFGDGRGEFSRDNGSTWTGFSQSENSVDHSDADIQFYFTTQ